MNAAKTFLRDRFGNFGVMTALLLVPLVGAAGLAVDYTNASSMKAQLMSAADAAAIGAIAETSPAMAAIQKMTTDGEVTVGDADGKALFLAQRSTELSQLPLDVSMTVTKTGNDIKSSVTFTAQVPTTFMQVLGWDSVDVSGTATASYGVTGHTYTDFYMLVDNTPSMGIGATQADINKLVAATANAPDAAGRNCAFACHMSWTASDGTVNDDKTSDYYIARANNVTLRIDVVASAAKALMDNITNSSSAPDQYRIAAYTFGPAALEPGYRIAKIAALTSDLPTVSNAVRQITLMTTDHHGFDEDALTSFDTSLTAIGKEISANGGDGSGPSARQEVVYMITDGLGDSRKSVGCTGYLGWANPDRCLEAIDLRYCQALKDRNIKIAILYTTYLPIPTDAIWTRAIQPNVAAQISPKLMQCASDGLFFEATPDADLGAAMKNLFVKASVGAKGLRLTQ